MVGCLVSALLSLREAATPRVSVAGIRELAASLLEPPMQTPRGVEVRASCLAGSSSELGAEEAETQTAVGGAAAPRAEEDPSLSAGGRLCPSRRPMCLSCVCVGMAFALIAARSARRGGGGPRRREDSEEERRTRGVRLHSMIQGSFGFDASLAEGAVKLLSKVSAGGHVPAAINALIIFEWSAASAEEFSSRCLCAASKRRTSRASLLGRRRRWRGGRS